MEYLAIRVDGPAAAGLDIRICWHVTDRDTLSVTRLHNAVLTIDPSPEADITVALDHATLAKLVHGQTAPDTLDLAISGDAAEFETFWAVMDQFEDDFALAGRHLKKGET